MEIIYIIGALLAGFAILLFGGDLLVNAAVSIAQRMNISPAVVAVTLVALGTSAPELLTSLLAALQGTTDVAVGNVIGSNIFNILAVLGITALVLPGGSSQALKKIEVPVFLLSAILFWGLSWDGQLTRLDGIGCILCLSIFWWISIYVSRKSDTDGDLPKPDDSSKKSLLADAALLIFSFILLIGGAKLTLYGGIELGKIFELSDRVIGLTIISIGTGLPELATSAVAAFKGRNDIALGNVLGSNILNILGVAGVTATVKNLPISKSINQFDMVWLLAATLLIVLFVYLPKIKIGRSVGVIFVISYIAYLFMLF